MAVMFTEDEVRTICFVGKRYDWSTSLLEHIEIKENGTGRLELTPSELSSICEAIESDMEGGHNAFPMLAPSSELAEKLMGIYYVYIRTGV